MHKQEKTPILMKQLYINQLSHLLLVTQMTLWVDVSFNIKSSSSAISRKQDVGISGIVDVGSIKLSLSFPASLFQG